MIVNRPIYQTLSDQVLAKYVAGQLNHFFDDGQPVRLDQIHACLPVAMERLVHCFSHVNNKYFFDGTRTIFNHLHADQYAMFLYLLANTAYKHGIGLDIASKLFLLNKTLHGLDAYFEVELPSVFLFVHPLATVLGRASYSDYLLVYQRTSIGSNHDIYPTLGKYFTLRPGATILGRSEVGLNCTLAAESLLIDRTLPDNSIYFGSPRDFATRSENERSTIWRV